MEAATVKAFDSEGVAAALRLAEQPEALLEQREALSDDCQLAVKQLFDLAKKLEPRTFTPLAELLVEGFSLDQIWEQIDLYNAPLLKYSQRGLKKHIAQPESVALPLPESDSDSDIEGDGDRSDASAPEDGAAQEGDDPYSAYRDDEKLDDDELAGSSDEEDSDPEAAAARVRRRLRAKAGGRAAEPGRRDRKKRHAMENSFFSFDDMEKFMDEAEEEWMNEYEHGDEDDDAHGDDAGWSYQEGDDDDAVPYQDEEGLFGDMQSDEEDDPDGETKSAAALKYSDFFDPPDKVDGKEDVEIGFNAQFGPPNKDEAGQSDDGDEEEQEEQADEDEDEEEDEDEDEEEEEEEEEEDEDGVGGFDSLRTDEDALQAGAGGTGGRGASAANLEEEDLDGELGPRSAFERAQAKLQREIRELEEQNVGQKRWETLGEVSAKTRPENSLLSSVLDFQHAGKVKPVVTAESTASLESLIKQRILDEAFDDVEAKVAVEVKAKKPRAEVSDERSKAGLGEIYEQDYVKEALGVQPTDKLSEEKQEMAKLFQLLSAKLDALTNYHFTPKPLALQDDLQVKANTAALKMEEVTPAAVSDASLLAPEEVFSKNAAETVAKSELSKAEKKALRAAKKGAYKKREAQRMAERQAIIRLVPAAGEKDAKKQAEKQLQGKSKAARGGIEKAQEVSDSKNFGSSKAFFQNLQDEADTTGFTNKRKGKGAGADGDAKKKAKRSHNLKL